MRKLILRADIDFRSLFLNVVLYSACALDGYYVWQRTNNPMAGLLILSIAPLLWLTVSGGVPAFIRRLLIPSLQLAPAEEKRFQVRAAHLVSSTNSRSPRPVFGLLALTTERLVFRTRSQSIDISLSTIAAIEHHSGLLGIATRWLRISTNRGSLVFSVRYPALLHDAIQGALDGAGT